MPTIECNKNDLLDLVGEELTDDELEEKLTRVKVEVEEIDGDRIEVETTSDRIDLLSVEGIARNLKSYLGKQPGLNIPELHDNDYRFNVEWVEARPYVVTAVVKGVELDTAALNSLIQLQEKLHGTFGRNRSRVSIGLHDMQDIEFPLTYKAAAPEEYRFLPLQMDREMTLQEILDEHPKGRDYAHIIDRHDEWPLIVDANDQVLSFPPIINAQTTEVTESSEDLFIDVTGTDLESISYALNVLVTALAERNGTVYQVEMDTPDDEFTTPVFDVEERILDLDRLAAIIGIELDPDRVKEYLERVGYGVDRDGGRIAVTVPPYRPDILHDVDIAEDIAIGYGYNNIEPELPEISTIGEENPMEKFMHISRELMVGHGYQEIMNPTISNDEVLLEKVNRESDRLVELENPVSENYTHARDLLLPQLLETLSRNTHNEYPQKIFEAADVIMQDDSQAVKTRTDKHLAAAFAGNKADFNIVRSELEGLLESLGVDADVEALDHPTFIDGRCASVKVDGEQIGFVGEVHPEVLVNNGLETPVAAFEIDLAEIKQ